MFPRSWNWAALPVYCAPYLDSHKYTARVRELYRNDRGVYLRPAEFQPTSQKWAGKTCRGLQIHILDPFQIETFKLGLSLLKAAADVGGSHFQWAQPPYEYDYENLPINLILGNLSADKWVQDFDGLTGDKWSYGIEDYISKVKPIILYEREIQNLSFTPV